MHRIPVRREGRKKRHPCRCVGAVAMLKMGVVATPTGGNALVPRARRDPTSEVLCAAQNWRYRSELYRQRQEAVPCRNSVA
jgi:hypothetical protein